MSQNGYTQEHRHSYQKPRINIFIVIQGILREPGAACTCTAGGARVCHGA